MSDLRIGIDATLAGQDGARGGVYQYTYHLVRQLAAHHVDRERPTLRLMFASPHPRHRRAIAEFLTALGPGPTPYPCPVPLHWMRRLHLPVELFVGRVNVFHSPAHLGLASLRTPGVVTIHDLAYLHMRDAPEDAVGLSGQGRRNARAPRWR